MSTCLVGWVNQGQAGFGSSNKRAVAQQHNQTMPLIIISSSRVAAAVAKERTCSRRGAANCFRLSSSRKDCSAGRCATSCGKNRESRGSELMGGGGCSTCRQAWRPSQAAAECLTWPAVLCC